MKKKCQIGLRTILGIFIFTTTTTTASTASTAQHSQPAQQAAKQVRADQSRRSARASMSSSIHTARCVLKTSEEIKICSAYKNIAGGVTREGFTLSLIHI